MRKKNKENSKIVIAFFSGIFIFVGIFSAVASWPTPPSGVTLGGWLGSIFDLNQSGTGELVVSSENLTLPNNVAITENEQVTTKKYVDNRVRAETLSSSSGGNELVCVADQFAQYLCQNINIPGYTKFVTSYSCCFKKVDQGLGKRIFVTGVGYNGNLGGETGADAKCQARADVGNLNGTFKAWLLDGTHEQYIYDKFADTSYYNMQGGKVITTFLDYNQGYSGFQTLEDSIAYDEFGRVNGRFVWTGLISSGSSSGPNCGGFTNNSDSSLQGYAVSSTSYYSHWYYSTIWSSAACSALNSLICVET